MNKRYTFAATCGAGTETLVAGEIEKFGGDQFEEGRGVVSWEGNLESGYRACLWSRFASRILLQVKTCTVTDEESLYQAALEVNWSEHMDVSTTFAIDATVTADAVINHSRFAGLKVKDAIVDQFRDQCGERPSVDIERAGVRINLLVKGDTAIFAIDLSGDALHKRGYRVEKSLAPLKENLAAAIVQLSGWNTNCDHTTPLVDPMCGSGTLLIEAALMYGDIAPGLSRNYFGFTGWKQHQKALWDTLVNEALAREDAGNEKEWPVIIGYDADAQAVRAARNNVMKAGLDDRIRIEKAELAYLQPKEGVGTLLSNLPFGERLSETEQVAQLYRALGRIAKSHFAGWKLAVFISNPELTDSFTVQWEDKHRLYNGSLQCRVLQCIVKKDEEQDFTWQVTDTPVEGDGADFKNRFRKNLKKTLKAARKNEVSCFRVYDRDLPDYNVSIDMYEKWVHVQEYAPPQTVEPKVASARFQTVLRSVREIFGIRADRVFIKTREIQRGKKQYQKKSTRRKMHEVREGKCYFLANFTDYLDTGVFLDHRPVREMIHQKAHGKRFLNLFGYTGTATVQAATGGAATTTTVDLSKTYTDWTKMNLSLNGFASGKKNRVVSADCMQWLQEDTGVYDLIFVDPPTFSNTKKERRVFDIQRDHYKLLELAMARLSEDGLLIFSTNFRRFKLDPQLSESYQTTDITRSTISFDFERNQKIHMCWEMRKKS